jgi:NAD+ kinase
MAVVALVLNRWRPRAVELAHQAVDWLTAHGHEVRLPDDDAEAAGLTKHACAPEELAPGVDLAVSLGGDGTMLRTVRLVVLHGVPVLGVNLGRLGYLADVEPEGLIDALERFLAGRFDIEERLLLTVAVDDRPEPRPDAGAAPAPTSGTHLALNEVVVEKPSAGQVVHVKVAIDGKHFTSYSADGLILATPTGSTAYSFSARGPIIAPCHHAFVLTPVSAHMAFDRSLVFDPAQTVHLEVVDRPAEHIVDGCELGLLGPGSTVTTCVAEHPARFVTLGPRDFYAVLKNKFGLADG